MSKFAKKRNRSIKLDELGIKKGAKLQFVPAAGVFTDIYVTVVDNYNVDFNGSIMTRATFNKENNKYQRIGTKTNEQQSTRYLYYKGNSLAELWKNYCENGTILEPKYQTKTEEKSKEGQVYIMVNPSFKDGIYKVGHSTEYKKRIKKLFTTGIPTPFEAIAVVFFPDCESVEKLFHEYLQAKGERILKNREFFKGNPEEAKSLLYGISKHLYGKNSKIIV